MEILRVLHVLLATSVHLMRHPEKRKTDILTSICYDPPLSVLEIFMLRYSIFSFFLRDPFIFKKICAPPIHEKLAPLCPSP